MSENNGISEYSGTDRRERINLILDMLPEAKPEDMAGLRDQIRDYLNEQEHRRKKAEDLALTDQLTGLGNRRGYDQRLNETVSRYRRNGGSLTVVRIDCDGLSDANEMVGLKHRAGDIYIREVSRAIKHSIRTTDYAARVGGDEFAVVVEGDKEAGRIVASRIQEKLGLRMCKLKEFADARKERNTSQYFEASTILNKSGMSIGIATEIYKPKSRDRLSGRELDMLADDAACAVKEGAGKAGTGVFRRESNLVYVEAAPYAKQRKEAAGNPLSGVFRKDETGIFRRQVLEVV